MLQPELVETSAVADVEFAVAAASAETAVVVVVASIVPTAPAAMDESWVEK